MKATKITYYVSTGLISLAMAFAAIAYFTVPDMKNAIQHLGFPDYFRIQLGVCKSLAAIALWLPFRLLKAFAYIGLTINLISASIAHFVVGDPIFNIIYPLIYLAILILSYVTYQKLSNTAAGKSE